MSDLSHSVTRYLYQWERGRQSVTWGSHRVHIFTRDETGSVYLPTQLALMNEYAPESRYYSVNSVSVEEGSQQGVNPPRTWWHAYDVLHSISKTNSSVLNKNSPWPANVQFLFSNNQCILCAVSCPCEEKHECIHTILFGHQRDTFTAV